MVSGKDGVINSPLIEEEIKITAIVLYLRRIGNKITVHVDNVMQITNKFLYALVLACILLIIIAPNIPMRRGSEPIKLASRES